ncbi:MAG: aspartate-semialdehyde dehydrogenase [Gammaproteobacteria bacterium]
MEKEVEKGFNVAVVGATGEVGRAMLQILAERKFPVAELHALASARSEGRRLDFGSKKVKVEVLDQFDFTGTDIVLSSAGGAISREFAPRAVAAGAIVIDNTSAFRYDDDVPLIVPEVNPEQIEVGRKRGIIANPNCSTIQLVVALKPIYDAVGIERINIATYQSVSGAGKKAISELADQSARLLNGLPIESKVHPKQIAFNVLPHIDEFQDNGYTREEMKLVWETRKILGDPALRVNPTAARVPVFYGHSEAVHIETGKKLTAEAARKLFSTAPGIVVLDERRAGGYATAVTEGAQNDAVYVSRIREDLTHPQGLDFWVVSDNIRKGAALNSVQIAELLPAPQE